MRFCLPYSFDIPGSNIHLPLGYPGLFAEALEPGIIGRIIRQCHNAVIEFVDMHGRDTIYPVNDAGLLAGHQIYQSDIVDGIYL